MIAFDDLPVFYFGIDEAVRIHDWTILHSGGLSGIRDLGVLESALDHIQHDLYYPTLGGKLTHLVFAINKFHAFNDGNKRSSIALGAYFLELNGYDYCVRKFVLEMENIVVWLAAGKIDKLLLERLISSIVMDDEYPEALKFDLLQAVGF